MHKPVILASASPRRRELLAQIGLSFVTEPADVDERILPGEQPREYAIRVAADKARTAAVKFSSGTVIAADTIVVLDGQILGKPADARDAQRMLTLLSGRRHEVITGVAVTDASGRSATAAEVTAVWFRDLSPAQIAAYVGTGEPLDKAGAYGIQEKGALLVRKIEGCYFNVVGLPLTLLADLLREFGIILL